MSEVGRTDVGTGGRMCSITRALTMTTKTETAGRKGAFRVTLYGRTAEEALTVAKHGMDMNEQCFAKPEKKKHKREHRGQCRNRLPVVETKLLRDEEEAFECLWTESNMIVYKCTNNLHKTEEKKRKKRKK